MKMSVFPASRGFTLVELLTVMVIILILAGLVLGTVGYAQKKAARSRAEGEIQALSTAIENYKMDNAVYPRGNSDATAVGTAQADTDRLNPNPYSGTGEGDPTKEPYLKASLALYICLTGDKEKKGDTPDGTTNYLGTGFKADIFGRPNASEPVSSTNLVKYLSDPFGNSYGYSTANSFDVANANDTIRGYNPTFDLWSTGGNISTKPEEVKAKQPQWIKNWQ